MQVSAALRTRLSSIINLQNGALLTSLLTSLFAYLYILYLAPGDIYLTYIYREILRKNSFGENQRTPIEKINKDSNFAMSCIGENLCCASIDGMYTEHGY